MRALKIIDKRNYELLDNAVVGENSEINLVAELDHPGIMRVFEWF